jgi:hypothetical protein
VRETPAYMPRVWYWRIEDDATQVYSSAARGYISVTDPGYQTWLMTHELGPTRIQKNNRAASEQELWNVLAEVRVALPSGATTTNDSKDRQIEGMNAATLAVLLYQENRTRARDTPPQPAFTMDEFKIYIRGLMI